MKAFIKFLPIQKTAAIAAVFFSLCIAACSPDDKKSDPTPAAPAADPKLRFVADWTCNENSHLHGAAQPFQVHCTNGSGDTVYLENIYALGFSNRAKAIISGDSIKIRPLPQQVGSVYILAGKGKLVNTSKFTMTYVVDDGNPVKDTVDATFTK